MKVAFSVFAESVKEEQPYCSILQTRSNYHCRWLLLKAKNTVGVINRKRGYYVIQSACVSKSVQRDMIINRDALPLSPVYDEVINSVETWGKSIKSSWSQDVYHYIFQRAKIDTDEQTIYLECLYRLVRKLTRELVGPARTRLLDGWIEFFDANYGDYIGDFKTLTIATIEYVEDSMNETNAAWNHMSETPSLHVVASEGQVTIASPALIPPSPVSSQSSPW